MSPAIKTEYLAACQDAENATIAMGAARARAQAAMNQAAQTNSPSELGVMDACYGMRWFDQSCQQSAGSKGLLGLFSGNPQQIVQTGVKLGGNVLTLMTARTNGF